MAQTNNCSGLPSTAASLYRLALCLLSVISLAVVPVHANEAPRPKEGDEVWEVSSRCLPDLSCGVSLRPVVFKVLRYTCSSGWQESDEAALQASLDQQPTMRTIIYAHGNWMTLENARGRSGYVYNRVSCRAQEPIRFISYSWPSQRDGRPLRDVYEKADRSNTDTYYFADLLTRIPESTPLGLIGFSFGARVVCGGLHMVGGGQLEGRHSPTWPAIRQVRVSLIAPAFDRTWLVEGREYSGAINQVDALVNIYNSRDPALRRFRFIDRVTTPIAAGFSGLADPRSTQPLQTDRRITQYDCQASVGSTHDELSYYRKCAAFNIAIDNALGK